jgi:Flp pilus assembly protein TadG
MRLINNKGIALITALMFTLIILVLIMGVLSMVNLGSKVGGETKIYKNTVEAAYGGADVAMNDVFPRLFMNTSTSIIRNDYNKASFNKMMTFGSYACIKQKRDSVNAGTNWSSCGDKSIDAKKSPDMTFQLVGTNSQSFTVYSKIVNTIPGVVYPGTNSSSGSQLLGGGVAESSAGSTMTLSHFIYRVEVTSEKTVKPQGTSKLSVLYEY